MLLLPNLTDAWAHAFCRGLQARLAETSYAGIERGPTISVGLFVVEPDCPLIDREVLARANEAKNFAKQRERGRIAGWAEGEARLLAP